MRNGRSLIDFEVQVSLISLSQFKFKLKSPSMYLVKSETNNNNNKKNILEPKVSQGSYSHSQKIKSAKDVQVS